MDVDVSKRFVVNMMQVDGDCRLIDNQTGCFYIIKDSFVNVKILCDRLNELYECNFYLKKENALLRKEKNIKC